MNPLILVFNCGSSSVKFSLINPVSKETLLQGLIEKIGLPEAVLQYRIKENKYRQALTGCTYESAFQSIFNIIHDAIPQEAILVGIGHRVVHGGSEFTEPTLITPDVVRGIEACCVFAPLHNPANLLGIRAAQNAFPNLPNVAVFDTAFHQTMPERAFLYALPYAYYKNYQVRRYGFHGISYRYLAPKAAEAAGKALVKFSSIIAHLGNGCSICAIQNGKSVDTSMGFTPLEGLVMGTRSGDIDPGLFDYLSVKLNCSAQAIVNILNKESGLLGISDVSMDMRAVEEAAQQGNAQAAIAIEIFCYRLAKYIAAMTVPLGKIDALVFSGGIGENASFIREKTLAQLAFLGFEIDTERNTVHGKNANGKITTDKSTPAFVIPTNEELMIAEDVFTVIPAKAGIQALAKFR